MAYVQGIFWDEGARICRCTVLGNLDLVSLGLVSGHPPPKHPRQAFGSGCKLKSWVSLLEGSWYLLTNFNCTYHPLISPLSALI